MIRAGFPLVAAAAILAGGSSARADEPDPPVLDLVVVALEDERDAVEANLPRSAPQPGDRAWLTDADHAGFQLLQELRADGEFVPDAAEALLELLPPPRAGLPLPAIAEYDAAIAEALAFIDGVDPSPASSAEPAGTSEATGPAFAAAADDVAGDNASGDDGGASATELVAIAVGLVGLGLGAFAIWRGRRHDRLADIASTDGLTGLRNRRMFDLDVDNEIDRGGQPTAMLMIDVDHFKTFNDVHGHAVGDEVLRKVGSVLAQTIRKGDVAYRYGGEEFCVLLPNTDATEAAAVAERVRRSIETVVLSVDATITASVGVAAGVAEELPVTIDLADGALYAAKDAGRNRISIA